MTETTQKTEENELKGKKPFRRVTRIESTNSFPSIKHLFKRYLDGELRFDLAIQRNEVWKPEQKSKLIHSILYGYPIPPVYVKSGDGNEIFFLDGKQRLTTLMTFIAGDWKLHKDTEDVFGFEIASCKFADLQEDMRDAIYDATIQLVEVKNMTQEETNQMFIRLNNGKPLTKIELSRAKNSDLMDSVKRVASLELFDEALELTQATKKSFTDQEMILQIAMLFEKGDSIKGFGSKQIEEYILELKEDDRTFSNELMNRFETISHYLTMAISDFNTKEKRQVFKKSHTPIIFHVVEKAIENKIKPVDFGEFLKTFFITKYENQKTYLLAVTQGSAKKESVLTRVKELTKSFNAFSRKVSKETENKNSETKTEEKTNLETKTENQKTKETKETKTVATTSEKPKPRRRVATDKAGLVAKVSGKEVKPKEEVTK